ncbi:MAG: glycosyltransferase family 4 protein [Candidatus Kerfeldbacteria bacterium]|nr:glycosyltransferase family 4 protein [Candidatus Kerfeldbacteria bacterium]
MRVLFLNSEYPPLGGGAGYATQELFRQFRNEERITIDCITAAIDNRYSTEQPFPNVTLYRVPIGDKRDSLHYQSQLNLFRYLLQGYLMARSLVRKNTYDFVHAFFTVPAGIIAYSFRRQLPYIISLRGSDVPGYNKRFQFIYTIAKPLFVDIWKKATDVVANSQSLADLAHKSMASLEIPVIPNGVDTEIFYPFSASTAEENKKKVRILCVSRLIERKGIDILIKSFAEIQSSFPQTELEIVGDGNIRVELEALTQALQLSKRVHFHGNMERSELPEIYRQADIFVLPSHNEGMSNTVLEAMASGLPLIITNTGDAEALASGNGIIIEKNNQTQLTAALTQLLRDAKLRQTYASASRIKSLLYSWQQAADEYKKMYQRMLD